MLDFFHSRDPVIKRLHLLSAWVDDVGCWTDRAHVGVGGWTAAGVAVDTGEPWPVQDGVVTFSAGPVRVPDEWPLNETELELDLGGEALLTIRDADSPTRSYGLDRNHGRFPVRAREFALTAEAVARLDYGAPNPDPRLVRSRLVWVDTEVRTFVEHLRTVAQAADALAEHAVAGPLLDAAERALAALDWPSATATVVGRMRESRRIRRLWAPPEGVDPHPPPLTDAQRGSVRRATEVLRASLDAIREAHPKTGAVALSGHAHIDLAWLWPVEETVRKLRRTLSTADHLLRESPAFRFAQSSAWAYETVEREDPALFERIRGHVEAGRWDVVGGMWVEPDANLPSGESLVRQLLYGQRYVRERFGQTADVGWMPDSFGFTPGLPQILRDAGVRRLFTAKPSWNETNRFPHDVFWWEGLDGSRVLCHTFENMEGTYNGTTTPEAVREVWSNFRSAAVQPETLYTVGHGDGGGGPTPEMVDRVEVVNRLPVLPQLRFTNVGAFFDGLEERAAEAGDGVPEWVGEWYLELHRGTYTSQGRTKRLHRRAEHALVAAEALAAMAHVAGGPAPPSLEAAWKRVLFVQFHDVVTGASIAEVYDRADRDLHASIGEADDLARQSLAALEAVAFDAAASGGGEGGLLIANPTLADRPVRLALNAPCPGARTAAAPGRILGDTAEARGAAGSPGVPPPADPMRGRRAGRGWAGSRRGRTDRPAVGEPGTPTRPGSDRPPRRRRRGPPEAPPSAARRPAGRCGAAGGRRSPGTAGSPSSSGSPPRAAPWRRLLGPGVSCREVSCSPRANRSRRRRGTRRPPSARRRASAAGRATKRAAARPPRLAEAGPRVPVRGDRAPGRGS